MGSNSEIAISLNWKFDSSSREVWKANDPNETYSESNKLNLSHASTATLEHDVISAKVRVWADKLEGWYLRPIEPLCEPGDGQFVATSSLLFMIEGLAKIHFGAAQHKGSRHTFIAGCKQVLEPSTVFEPTLPAAGITVDHAWEALYVAFRCGFGHDGFSTPALPARNSKTKPSQILTIKSRVGTALELSTPVRFEVASQSSPAEVTIYICPKRLLGVIRTEIGSLATSLQTAGDQRRQHLDALFLWPG